MLQKKSGLVINAAAFNHPYIVTIYDINEHEEQIYIAMEYVESRQPELDIFLQFFFQQGHDLEKVSYDPVIGFFKYRSFRIFINSYNYF